MAHRLRDRATHPRDDRGGGSGIAPPVVEAEEQNISPRIPTDLISIIDGQIHLSPELFRKGNLAAIGIGRSVSRMGGQAQLPVRRGFAEPAASEHASRLQSMQAAERNIEEKLDEQNAELRRRRQDAIAAELLDMVSGYEALSEEEAR